MPGSGKRFHLYAFVVLLLLNLLYIWQQTYFLTSDGPTHLYNSKILLDLFKGNQSDLYHRYFNIQLHADPNWFTHLFLAVLQLAFKPLIAEKILLSLIVLLLPLSVLYMVKRFNPDKATAAILVFPLTFHFLLYYGFYNYCLGIAAAFLFVGLWLQLRQRKIALQLICLITAGLLLYATHILGWLIAGAILFGVFVANARFNYRNLKQLWLPVSLAAVLPIGLSLYFAQTHQQDAQHYPQTMSVMWRAFSSLEVLRMFDPWEQKVATFFVAFLTLLLLANLYVRIRAGVQLNAEDSLLLAALILLLLYFIQPAFISMGGFWIGRFSWLPWLLLVAWLATQAYSRVLLTVITTVIVFITIALWWVRYPYQQKLSEAETDYLSAAEIIPSNSTVLPLCFSHGGMDANLQPITNDKAFFLHAFDYAGTDKTIVNLANFEATTSWFPVQWKKDCSPFINIGRGNNIEGSPPDVRLDAMECSPCNIQVNYVICWCRLYNYTEWNQWTLLDKQLKEQYTLVYLSPTRRTEVWKHN